MEATITKLELINALGETTKLLKESRKALIEKLFEVQIAAEKEIIALCEQELITPEDWGVSWLKCRYNNYFCYNGKVIEESYGRYDGGDFNSWVPATDYNQLIEFVKYSQSIIKGMQSALSERIDSVNEEF